MYALSLSTPVARLGVALFALSGLATGWLGEARLRAHSIARAAARVAATETARAEQEALHAEEEAARAEEESARAEEMLHAAEVAQLLKRSYETGSEVRSQRA